MTTAKLTWHTEKRKISSLKPFEKNPRRMTDKQAQDLKASLEKFDLVEIPAVDVDNKIIAGHQRLKILSQINASNGDTEIDVRVPNRKLTDAEFQEYNLRSNKNTGEFDFDLLADFDKNLLIDVGFDNLELEDIFRNENAGLTDPDDVPETPAEPKTKTGELWLLGNHRLLCGDATKPEDVERLMDGKKADMVFTDPPYAVNYGHDQELLQKKSGGKFSKTRKQTLIKNDNLSTEECAEQIWKPAFKNLYEFSNDDCSFYLTMCQGGDQMMMMMMMMDAYWQIKHELIWVKNSQVFSMGRLDYDYQHEPILFGWKKKHNFYGKGQFQTSVWEVNKPLKNDLHPTMKPIELIENAILNSSLSGQIVIDFFGGSGSTIITCQKLNRHCYMMEIEPMYIDVILERWTTFTGKDPVREDGVKWSEIKC